MADQHNDNIPAIANVILTDIGQIKENLEYHKDVIQAITTGWSNTSTTNILPKISTTTLSADSTKTISSLTATGIYRAFLCVDVTDDAGIGLRFNADTGSNYVTLSRYEYDGAAASIGQESDASITYIPTSLAFAGVHTLEFIFGASPGDNTRIITNFRSSIRKIATSYYGFRHGMGFYDGASNMTSFTIFLGAGTMTGSLYLERLT